MDKARTTPKTLMLARNIVTEWLGMFDPPPQIDFQQSEFLQGSIAAAIEDAKARTSPVSESLLPCPFCGMHMTLQGDYTEESAWNFYCHADRDAPETSTCPMKDHQINTMRDMRTPDHNEAVAWNTRRTGVAQRLDLREQSPLDWLATKSNYELSYDGWNEDPVWQVHSVNGGRNDREWTLRATGNTPEEALRRAMALSDSSTDRACACNSPLIVVQPDGTTKCGKCGLPEISVSSPVHQVNDDSK